MLDFISYLWFMTNTSLQLEINSLPFSLRAEVADFINSLKQKNKKKSINDQRQFGVFKDKIIMSDDFDEPLDEFKDYM